MAISSHLSRVPVRQPPYVHPARSGPRSSLFLPSSAVTVCEVVADNWFGQDSGAALIASRFDYCNSVLYQINTTATKTLQSVLHSAARLIMRKWKFDRITPTLQDDLHWLPVRERIVFKLCSIIFKCRHQTAPQYLQELCVPVTASTSRRHLRSAARGDLQVLACHTSSFGPRSFTACAPKLWNSLPLSLRDPTLTLTLFCSRLKTHLFGLAYGRALVTA